MVDGLTMTFLNSWSWRENIIVLYIIIFEGTCRTGTGTARVWVFLFASQMPVNCSLVSTFALLM